MMQLSVVIRSNQLISPMKLSRAAALFLLISGILSAGQPTDSSILDTFVLNQKTQSGYTVTLELENDFIAPVDETGWLYAPIVINGAASGVVISSVYYPWISTQTQHSFTIANVKAVHEKEENNATPTYLPLIHGKTNHTTSFTGLKDVTFRNNTCASKTSSTSNTWLGAIRLDQGASLSISDNTGKVTFSNNKLTDAGNSSMGAMNGGVIYAAKNFDSVTLDNNAGGIAITGNGIKKTQTSGACYGGFMYVAASGTPQTDNNISICGNSSVDISSNYAIREATTGSGDTYGGAFNITSVDSRNRSLDISRNTSNVSISENIAKATTGSNGAQGGFLKASYYGLKIDDNAGKVTLSRNAVEATGTTLDWNGRIKGGEVKGGAAVVTYAGISLCDNQNGIEISGNHGYSAAGNAEGGAFHNDRNINISQNKGEVVFTGNYVQTDANADTANDISARGGAIYFGGNKSERITFNNNDKLSFTNNYAASAQMDSTGVEGGAIYINGGALEIAGNGDVEFSGNYVRKGDSVSFNAVCLEAGSTNTEPVMQLAAGEKKCIIFRDSVNITASTSQVVSLNAAYKDAEGETHQATGNIVFTGKDAAGNSAAQRISHLKTSLGITDATADIVEISKSTTSKIDAAVALYNGTLRVEDGARLETLSFTIAEAAVLHLKNGGSLSTAQSDELLFGEGSQIMVQGCNNTITATNLHLANDVTITFDLSAELEMTTFNLRFTPGALLTLDADTLTLGDHITIDLINVSGVNAGEYQLLDFGSGYTEEQMKEIEQKFTFTVDGAVADFSFVEGKVFANVTAPVIPEPSTATLSLMALCGLALRRRRK